MFLAEAGNKLLSPTHLSHSRSWVDFFPFKDKMLTPLLRILPRSKDRARPRLRHIETRPQPKSLSSSRSSKLYLLGTFSYTVLIVYGSLYPLSGWRVPAGPIFSFLTAPFPDQLSRADVLTNVLAYIPLGGLIAWTLRRGGKAATVIVAAMAGAALSFAMESVQMFLPSRTSSNVDLLTNIAGVALGALAGCVFRPGSGFRQRLTALRSRWFAADQGVDVGLAAVLLWASSQLSPFVPSMDVSSVRRGLSPLWYGFNNPSSISGLKVASYALDIAGLGLLTTVLAHAQKRVVAHFLLFAGLVLCLKPFIVERQLSLEAISGLVVAGALLALAPRGKGARALLAMLCIVAGFMVQELTPFSGTTHDFNWMPFAGQVDNTVSGFASILEGVWPFVALSALTMLGFGLKKKPMLYGGGILLLMVFGLEWAQQQIPGRYGDITTLILAALGWTIPWLSVNVSLGSSRPTGSGCDLRRMG